MRITWLAAELRRAGLTVVEHGGWETHARPGDWEPQFGIVHATAAPRTQSDAAQVAIVRDGRSDLLGPIGNACVDRQGRWHVLSAGRCNTTLAGTAGPYAGLGNTHALGVEACNDNGLTSPAEEWPDVQYEAYYRGWAAITKRLGWGPERLRGHREHTPGRKTDPTFSMTRFREDVAAAMRGDDVSQADVIAALRSAEGQRLIGEAVKEYRIPIAGLKNADGSPVMREIGTVLSWLDTNLGALRTAVIGAVNAADNVDEQALADALMPLLTGDQLEDVIRKGMTTEERLAFAARLQAG